MGPVSGVPPDGSGGIEKKTIIEIHAVVGLRTLRNIHLTDKANIGVNTFAEAALRDFGFYFLSEISKCKNLMFEYVPFYR